MTAKLERLWHRLLRAGGFESRTLQIREILDGAEEHLQAVALTGLESRYLASRLEVTVSVADFENLEPFAAHLDDGLREVYRRLGERTPWVPLVSRPETSLESSDDLPPGSAPRFRATFPPGERHASWAPGSAPARPKSAARRPRPEARPKRPAPVTAPAAEPPSAAPPATGSPSVEPAEGPSEAVLVPIPVAEPEVEVPFETTAIAVRPESVLELVVTAQSVNRTALQTILWLWLEPTLATGWWHPKGLELGLRPDAGGGLRSSAGEVYDGELPGRVKHRRSAPDEGWPERLGPPPEHRWVHRFALTGKPDVLWAPGGVVLIGRRSSQVHWVPASAPRNLSGCHLALVRAADGAMAVVDLESTNGTLLDARRLSPWQRVAVHPPVAVDVGQEGALRLDVRVRDLGGDDNPWR